MTVQIDKGNLGFESRLFEEVTSYDVAEPFFIVCTAKMQHYLPMCWVAGVKVHEDGRDWEKKMGWVT